MDNSPVIVTENLWAYVSPVWRDGKPSRSWFTLHCPQLNFSDFRFRAKNQQYARVLAVRMLSERAVWLSRKWKQELQKLTKETLRLTRELENAKSSRS
jgi:hypothetical protein